MATDWRSSLPSLRSPVTLTGVIVLVIALACLIYDLGAWFASGIWQPMTVGSLWFSIDRTSLNGLQVIIQREDYLNWPALWDGVVQPVLLWPFWAFLAGIGVFFLLLGWAPWRGR